MNDTKKEYLAASKKMINHCEKQIPLIESELEEAKERKAQARREIWRLQFHLLYLLIRRLFLGPFRF